MTLSLDLLKSSISENEASLEEVHIFLQEDPTSVEALQLEQELLETLADLRNSLAQHLDHSSVSQHSEPESPKGENAAAILLATAETEDSAGRKRHATTAAEAGPVQQRSKAARNQDSSSEQQMHPCNIHSAALDFKALAQQYPALLPYLMHKPGQDCSFDFTSSDAARELTKALLHQGYGIEWWVPCGQLIPPVPNRANYIHWIQDLLQLSSPAGQGGIKGMDIGCGANLIYSLLGAAIYGWHFIGADITDIAIEWAEKNCTQNPELSHLITIRRCQADISKGIITSGLQPGEAVAFTMCNPPFFDSMDKAGLNPATSFGGTAAEMVCPGGEDAFVRQMICDSLELRGRVHWYTTMVGKKVTLKAMRQLLTSHRVSALRTTEFVQGQTRRWGLAWSFAVAPDAAAVPLPRAGLPPPRLSRRVKKPSASFTVRAPAASGSRLLSLLVGALEAQGCSCSTDAQAFSIRAEAAVQGSPPGELGDAPRIRQTDMKGTAHGPHGSGGDEGRAVAAHGLSGSSGNAVQAVPASDSERAPGSSRLCAPAPVSDLATSPKAERPASNLVAFSVLLSVHHAAGEFAVRTSVPSDSSAHVLQSFHSLMDAVQTDVCQMLC